MNLFDNRPSLAGAGATHTAPVVSRHNSALLSPSVETGTLLLAGVLFLAISTNLCVAADTPALYQKESTWAETLLSTRAARKSAVLPEAERAKNCSRLCEAIHADFPVPWDWARQDSDGRLAQWFDADTGSEWERRLIGRVLEELADRGAGLRPEFEVLCQTQASPNDPRWWDLYIRACEQRRAWRLKTVGVRAPRIIFTKRHTIHPSFFAYTEGQSDAQNERHFHPGAELCLWTLEGAYGQSRALLTDPGGVIRDPAVSWDGARVVFAWKQSLEQDDYHLYEFEVGSGRTRQITSGLGFADYEPAYLPNGDLIFASTRCVQTVDCWWTEVSNLYTCDPEGRFLRRLSFDQVHAIYPQVLGDGRVIYTRRDYNDRGQMFPQALFQMNADGTGQTEFYGNNSWFPTTIGHARGIPGTEKVLAVFMGHHTTQAGKLGILDPAKGRQENAGTRLIAPVRATPAERIDDYGQQGELFQYPFPLTETEFLVSYAPLGWTETHQEKGGADFGIYWMDINGRRELLVTDPALACQQPVPLMARARPPVRPTTIDYRQTAGTYYLQDIYAGLSLAGVPRGTIQRLRVVALEYRAAGVGNNSSSGPGGIAIVCTPVAIGNGSWDVKIVLGDAKVHADGSAFFTVPARTPVYFQALDAQGHAVQTMRSWSTLQPGENAACVGCHEPKNSAPPVVNYRTTLALKAGPQALEPFYGPPRGFSFPKEIQPILDRHCISCHNDRNQRMPESKLAHAPARESDPEWKFETRNVNSKAGSSRGNEASSIKTAFSLLGDETVDTAARRRWSEAYLNLTLSRLEPDEWNRPSYVGAYDGRIVNWIGSQSIPAPLPPYAAGACRSDLFTLLDAGHYGVHLSREERDKLACWIDLFVPYCGDYTEANAWSAEEMAKYQRYLAKRKRMEAMERQNLQTWLATQYEVEARKLNLSHRRIKFPRRFCPGETPPCQGRRSL